MKLYGRPFIVFVLFLYASVCFLSSCSVVERTTVKNYPTDTPFVFSNKLVLKSNLPKDEKKRLTLALDNYWDDSLKTRKVQQFGIFYKIKNPPIFDTANIARTQKFMNAYLNAQGYYYASYSDTFRVNTFKNQLRTTVTITVSPGKITRIDSVGYALSDTTLESITLSNTGTSLIKPGKTPLAKDILARELDRLVGLYREHGYFMITRDNLIAEVDTTDISLLQLTLDPFEQAEKITASAEKRKNNPIAIVTIKNRESLDSVVVLDTNVYKQYVVGNIYYYPETKYNATPDSLMVQPQNVLFKKNEFTMYGSKGLFVFKPIREHTFMHKGAIYNEDNYYKTINNFSQMGAWQQVDARTAVRGDSIDFHYFLTPAVKQNVTVDLEASRNTSDILTAGNLFGLALNTTYRNRNVWRRAIQSSTSLRNGVELSFEKDNPLLQTVQSSLSHTYSFPRFISPFKLKGRTKLDNIRTLLSLNASYSERKDFFRVRSFVANWGYEWKKKNKVWQYKPMNIELYSLDTLPDLDTAFQTNPFLRTAFNTGSVVSQVLTYNVTYPSKKFPNQSNYIRFAIEEAGGILGRIKSLQDNLYQYIRLEGEFRRLINLPKTSIAIRTFAGLGYNYGHDPKFGNTLPFFKQFVAGGPNSMRAWSLRQLGLGSSLLSDTAGTKNSAFRDRFGDLQLEANFEYRYKIADIGSMKLGGALFTDAGNIWNVRKDTANPNSQITLKNLGKDIAVGIGTGIRLDFNYFLIRVDFGIKLKDPARLANHGWLDFTDFTWKNYEFEKRDAKGEVISPNRNNFAVQLGIGLPF